MRTKTSRIDSDDSPSFVHLGTAHMTHAKRRLRSVFSTGVRLLVSVGLLWYVVSTVGVETLLANLRSLRPEALALAVLLSVFGVGLSAWKWRLLLAVKSVELSFRAAWLYYYIGQFFNTFLPSVIGGDTARMYYLYSDTNDGSASVSSVVVERILGLYSILLIVVVGTAVGYEIVPGDLGLNVLVGSGIGLITIPLFVFTAGLRPVLSATIFRVDTLDIGSRLEELYTAVYEYRDAKRAVALALAVSLVFRLVLIGSNYVVALGLGIDISPIYFFIFVPLVELLLFLPISIQGFGVRESAYLYLFTAVGVPAGTAITFGLVMQIILRVVNNLIGGVVYVYCSTVRSMRST